MQRDVHRSIPGIATPVATAPVAATPALVYVCQLADLRAQGFGIEDLGQVQIEHSGQCIQNKISLHD